MAAQFFATMRRLYPLFLQEAAGEIVCVDVSLAKNGFAVLGFDGIGKAVEMECLLLARATWFETFSIPPWRSTDRKVLLAGAVKRRWL